MEIKMHNVVPGLIVAAVLIFTAIVYPQLPETMATHWGVDGRPNDFSSRAVGAWLMPGIMFLVWLLMRFLPRIDPRRENYRKFAGTYTTIITMVLAFMGLLHVVVLGYALGWPVNVPRLVPLVVGLMFVLLGNLLPRARPNWFVGIRTPWTLSSDRVWERTHRLGGVMFVLSGLVMIASALGPPSMMMPAIVIAIVAGGLTPVLYSLVLWLREKKSGGSQSAA
jgi:uncharacterized membrane protein